MNDSILELIASVVVLAVILGASFIWKPIQCEAKTEGMGMQSKWSVTGGCQVKTEKGWVPLENYRAL